MKFAPFVCSCLFLVLIGLPGCGQQSSPATSKPARKTAERAAEPLTHEEIIEFALVLEEAISDPEKWDIIGVPIFNLSRLLERASVDLEIPPHARPSILIGIKSGLFSPMGLMGVAHRAATDGGTYQFLKVVDREDGPRAQFRLLAPDQGLNYHELILEKNTAGSIQIVDAFVQLQSEMLSVAFRRNLIPMVVEGNRNIIHRLLAGEQAFVKHMPQLESLANAMREGDYEQAINIYAALPLELRREKNFVLLRYQAACLMDDDAQLQAAMADIQKYLPGDPCVELMLVDQHFLDEDYEKVVESLNLIDAAVQGDVYLNVLRATAYRMNNQRELAVAQINAALTADPTLSEAYYVAVELSLEDQDHAKTLALLIQASEHGGLLWGDMTDEPDYADFVNSPQHAEWLTYLQTPFPAETVE